VRKWCFRDAREAAPIFLAFFRRVHNLFEENAQLFSQWFSVRTKSGSSLNLQMLFLFVLIFCEVLLCVKVEKNQTLHGQSFNYQGTTNAKTTAENVWKNNHCFRTRLLMV